MLSASPHPPAPSEPARSPPDAEFAEPFTQAAAVRELGRPRRGIDPDKVVNWSTSGREQPPKGRGQRTTGYALPMGLAALPGDTRRCTTRSIAPRDPPGRTPGEFATIEPETEAARAGG
jgi:hypothetical protein